MTCSLPTALAFFHLFFRHDLFNPRHPFNDILLFVRRREEREKKKMTLRYSDGIDALKD